MEIENGYYPLRKRRSTDQCNPHYWLVICRIGKSWYQCILSFIHINGWTSVVSLSLACGTPVISTLYFGNVGETGFDSVHFNFFIPQPYLCLTLLVIIAVAQESDTLFIWWFTRHLVFEICKMLWQPFNPVSELIVLLLAVFSLCPPFNKWIGTNF